MAGIKIKVPKIKPPKIKKPKIIEDVQDALDSAAKSLDPAQIKKAAQMKANELAGQYKAINDGGGGYDDCVTVVAAGMAAAGAAQGGPVGAAIGAGGGVPLARIACRKVYPK